MKVDVVDYAVIGFSLAGISAALTLAQRSRNVVVIDFDRDTDAIEDVPYIQGTDLGVATTGNEFQRSAKELLEKAGVLLVTSCHVASVAADDDVQVLCSDRRWSSKGVVFAPNGTEPGVNVEGIDRLFGFGVSYSAASDAMYFRSRPVAVFGDYPRVIQHATIASGYAASVSVFVKECEADRGAEEYRALQSSATVTFECPVKLLAVRASDGLLESVEYQSGSVRKRIEVAALFVAQHLTAVTDVIQASASEAVVNAGLTAGVNYWDHAALVNDGARAAEALLAVRP